MMSILFCVVMGSSDMIKLPDPEFTGRSIEECIELRRSVRSYQDKALTLQQISNILWSAQGLTEDKYGFRAVPSAGATYPLVVFIANKDGLFRYIPESHALKHEIKRDIRKDIANAALGQGFINDAGVVVIITAIYERTTQRYGERGVRYVHIEAGHCAQNIHLEAVALGLGSVPVGAFNDEKLSKLLKLEREKPLYVIPVGHTR
ncbi:MAG: SagB/ThcOx family dehydrogenase [candidate division WOR-3 bacterium]|nr:SagB/ThcOx family dehydrogenase [candidate division WOR-3 bacterium]